MNKVVPSIEEWKKRHNPDESEESFKERTKNRLCVRIPYIKDWKVDFEAEMSVFFGVDYALTGNEYLTLKKPYESYRTWLLDRVQSLLEQEFEKGVIKGRLEATPITKVLIEHERNNLVEIINSLSKKEIFDGDVQVNKAVILAIQKYLLSKLK